MSIAPSPSAPAAEQELTAFTHPPIKWNSPLAITILLFHLALPIAFFPYFFSWWGIPIVLIGNCIFGSIGINLGYHRLLTHRSLWTPKWLERLFVGCGICSLEGSPLRWVCTHRIHHQHGDDHLDPHSPVQSFFWGHMGWICADEPRLNSAYTYEKYIPDLMTDPFLKWVHRRYRWMLVYLAHAVAIVVIGFLLGLAVTGTLVGAGHWAAVAFAWGVLVRTVYVWHITWFVNSAAHRWGYRNYSTSDQSTNNWWVAALTNGEGWHNNHHASPRAAAHGHRWWEIDLTYSFIKLLALFGLAREVVPIVVPKARMATTSSPNAPAQSD
ncbi:MAG TPA: fatty acid desaturase [Planctomycetia bacterium]|nr:fatty acid desaturase [Planctomycetia bacterium]